MIKSAQKWFRGQFGRYIASESSTRRRDPGTLVKSSDNILDGTKRRRLIEGARELWRNYAVAAWAIRKHLDYVATFTFQASTGDDQLNQELENLMGWYSRSVNCDVARRHPLRRLLRLLEARRTIDGDVWVVKLADGRIQPIEGDRVRDPRGDQGYMANPDRWTHGVETGGGGEIRSIAIHKRLKHGGYEFERRVRSSNVWQLGYFDAFDQVRGVSPLASAIHQFQDAMEANDYALAKAKVTQLFALAITRKIADFGDEYPEDAEPRDYNLDPGKGPAMLDMEPGDEATFLESKHPSTEFQSYLTLTLQAALKSLDIPWSFYDESFTNFFGSKSALIQYQQSVRAKRADLQDFLNNLTGWRIRKWIARGVLQLPAGMSFSQLKWEWIPAGVPWWDAQKEVAGDVAAIEAGLKTRSEIRRERMGDDWRDVVKKLADEKQYMQSLGIETTASVPAETPEDIGESEDVANRDVQDSDAESSAETRS